VILLFESNKKVITSQNKKSNKRKRYPLINIARNHSNLVFKITPT